MALRGHADVDIGAYIRTVGATPGRNIIQILSGPYRIPHIDLSVSLHLTNKTPVGTYRGPGRYEADFCRERLFDMIAAELHIDRVELRRRNLIASSEMPYELATVVRPEDRSRDRQRRLLGDARPLPCRDRLGREAGARTAG